MTGPPLSGMSPPAEEEIFYPCSDGEPMAETELHLFVMLYTIATLRQQFELQPRIYVIGNMFLYVKKGHPEACKAPDVMVFKDVEPRPHRDNFKVWEENAVPAVIIEVTSPSTAKEDLEDKKDFYEQLGVREYFLFDPKHEYLDQPLLGFRLINGVYEPLPPARDGGIVCSELMLVLKAEGSELALYNFRTGERLLTPMETHRHYKQARKDLEQLSQKLNEALELAEEERRRADSAEKQVADERQRAATVQNLIAAERQRTAEVLKQAADAQKRIDELAAEVARLRAGLSSPPAPTPPPPTP